MHISSVEYTDFLHREFQKRKERNSSYSMRAFGRDLGIAPQQLCKIMLGRCGLSSSKVDIIVKKMSLSDYEAKLFRLLVESKHSRSSSLRQKAEQESKFLIAEKILKTVDANECPEFLQWYMAPIVLLTELEDFKPNHKYIAKKLSISEKTASKAIALLFEKGFLIADENGRWTAGKNNYAFVGNKLSSLLRKQYSDLIDKAQKSVHQEPFQFRDITSSIMTIDPDDLDLLREEIKKFRHSFLKKSSETLKKPKRIYGLNIQFFPIDQIQDQEKESNL